MIDARVRRALVSICIMDHELAHGRPGLTIQARTRARILNLLLADGDSLSTREVETLAGCEHAATVAALFVLRMRRLVDCIEDASFNELRWYATTIALRGVKPEDFRGIAIRAVDLAIHCEEKAPAGALS